MESIYANGEYVFVRSLITETDEDVDDVRYLAETAKGKFRVSQKDDVLKRSPDSYVTDLAIAAIKTGRLQYFRMIWKMFNMTEIQIKACFGEEYTTPQSVIQSEHLSYMDIYAKWAEWERVAAMVPQLYERVIYNGETCAILGLYINGENIEVSVYKPSTREIVKVTDLEQITLSGKILTSIEDILNNMDEVVENGSYTMSTPEIDPGTGGSGGGSGSGGSGLPDNINTATDSEIQALIDSIRI